MAQSSTVPCLKPHDSQIPRWKSCHSDEHLPATVQRFNMLRHIYIYRSTGIYKDYKDISLCPKKGIDYAPRGSATARLLHAPSA